MSSCVIVGHSYVRRLRQSQAPSPFSGRRDITRHDVMAARHFARNLSIAGYFDQIYTFSENINLSGDLTESFRTRSNLLIMNFGSNDISRLRTVDKIKVQHLAEVHFDWAMNSGAKMVLFIGVLQRTGRLQGSVACFGENRDIYNNHLRNLCEGKRNAMFGRVRGYETTTDAARKQLSVCDWSSDGIHPDRWSHYAKRLKYLMMNAMKQYNKYFS